MTKEEIIQAISDDKMMPFIQPDQLSEIVNFVIENYKPSIPSDLDEAAKKEIERFCSDMLNVDIIWARMPLTKRFGLQMAKFGAEWMAGQGVSMLGKVGIYGVDVESITKELREAGFNLGEEIILQIRKKQSAKA